MIHADGIPFSGEHRTASFDTGTGAITRNTG